MIEHTDCNACKNNLTLFDILQMSQCKLFLISKNKFEEIYEQKVLVYISKNATGRHPYVTHLWLSLVLQF